MPLIFKPPKLPSMWSLRSFFTFVHRAKVTAAFYFFLFFLPGSMSSSKKVFQVDKHFFLHHLRVRQKNTASSFLIQLFSTILGLSLILKPHPKI